MRPNGRIAIVMLFSLLAANADAQDVVAISATRTISADGVIDEVGSPIDEAHEFETGPEFGLWDGSQVPNGVFVGPATGPRIFGGADAGQLSTVGVDVLEPADNVGVDAEAQVMNASADVQDPGFESTLTTQSQSTLDFTFEVLTTATMTLFYELFVTAIVEEAFGNGDALAAGSAFLSLCGNGSGCIINESAQDGRADGSPVVVSDTVEMPLAADVYTLSVSADAFAFALEDGIAQSDASFDVIFSVVPAPSRAALEIAAILGLVGVRARFGWVHSRLTSS